MNSDFRPRTSEEDDLEEDVQLYDPASNHRAPEYGVDLLFLDRWSPKAMSGEPISEHELMSLFEAARWAPSHDNNQPWRFLYALRDTSEWEVYTELLEDETVRWARNASALVVILSKQPEEQEEDSPAFSFDTGAAWANFALQGTRNGLVINGLLEIDRNQVRNRLQVPDTHRIETMVAVGKPGDKEELPEDLQEEEHPSDRMSVDDFVTKGLFEE